MVDELLAAAPAGIKALARAALRAPERLLHGARFRAAHRMVLWGPRPRRLLVVCYGNICRSPYAAAVLHSLTRPLGIEVESAGFIGPGRPAPAAAIEAALRSGVDLSSHRSRVLTGARVRGADLILTMDAQQAAQVRRHGPEGPVIPLGDFDPESRHARTIADPIEQPLAAFVACYERIDRCARQLATTLRRGAAARTR